MIRAIPICFLFAMAAGCGDDDEGPPADADSDVDADSDADSDADTDTNTEGEGFHLGTFALDTFWIPRQSDYPGGEETTLIACGGGEPIATVTTDFVAAIEAEGMGKLDDGRVVVLGAAGACYTVSGSDWGIGSAGRALEIFRSVTVHPGDIDLDRWLWIPQMDGVTMPGETEAHDGCVRVDDEGRGAAVSSFALFVGLASNEAGVVDAVGAEVDAYQDSPECFGWEG